MPRRKGGAASAVNRIVREEYPLTFVNYRRGNRSIYGRYVPDAYSTWMEPRHQLKHHLPLF